MSRAQRSRITLPDGAGWRGAERGSFFVAEHAATGTTLWLRVWRAPRLVRPEECRADARLRAPRLQELGADEVVERRGLSSPASFSGEVVVGVRDRGPVLEGHVQAFGAAIGACLAVVFETRVAGAEPDKEVGRRLAALVDALSTVEVQGVEGRLER